MIYSAILDNYTVIADYSEEQGDFQVIMIKLLKANRQSIEFYVVPYSQFEIYFLHYDNYTFCCIGPENIDNEKVLFYLQTLKEEFLKMYKTEKDSLTLKSTSLIRETMFAYYDQLKNDKLEKIENQLESLKNEKLQIIEKAYDKDLFLNSILPKSENLKRSSFEMKYNIKKRLDNVKKTSMKFYIFLTVCFYIKYVSSIKQQK